jgi:hypothetical protein
MATIKVPSRISDNFGDGLDQFFLIVGQINDCPINEAIELDMTSCTFLTPFFLLPLMVLIKSLELERKIDIRNDAPSSYFRTYLDYIHFGDGLLPESTTVGEYDSLLDQYSAKTYIPIINFPATRSKGDTDIRDKFLSALNNLLIKQLNLKGGFLTAVMYLLDEAINNIVDHSKEERGFIFAQSFPSKNFIDICVVDRGITILGTYKEKGEASIISDKLAISSAANGKSTKDRPENEGRGFGISTSKDMLVNGLKGKYLLFSGGAFLIKTIDKEEIVGIPSNLYFKGTMLLLRVPSLVNVLFDPSQYYGG